MGTRVDYVWTLGEFKWEVTGRNEKGDINWELLCGHLRSLSIPFHEAI